MLRFYSKNVQEQGFQVVLRKTTNYGYFIPLSSKKIKIAAKKQRRMEQAASIGCLYLFLMRSSFFRSYSIPWVVLIFGPLFILDFGFCPLFWGPFLFEVMVIIILRVSLILKLSIFCHMENYLTKKKQLNFVGFPQRWILSLKNKFKIFSKYSYSEVRDFFYLVTDDPILL